MKYPTILIFTLYDIFEDNSSVSFTVRSFLEKWPRENIIQVLCEDFNSGKPGKVSDSLFRLSHCDLRIASWLIKGKREVKTAVRPQHVKQSRKNSLLKGFTFNLRQLLVELYAFLPYRRNNDLNSFIEEAIPNLIYCNTSSPRMYSLCDFYSRRLSIPFYPHIMDDWPNVIGTSTPLALPINRYYKRHLISIFGKCPAVFCISEYMCEEYRKRYKYDHFVPLMHSVDIQGEFEQNNRVGVVKTIIYAGSLYLERNVSIIKLADAITKLELTDFKIVLYTHEKQWEELESGFKPYKCVEYGGFISQEELNKRIADAWGLLLIESFDEEMLDYTRLSMSTKIPEYLASGKPILAIGNPLQGSIKYIKENNAGYVSTSIDDLQVVFKEFTQLEGYKIKKNNAALLFENNHRKDIQQEKFLSIVGEDINK